MRIAQPAAATPHAQQQPAPALPRVRVMAPAPLRAPQARLLVSPADAWPPAVDGRVHVN
jgi:hypothetical protein